MLFETRKCLFEDSKESDPEGDEVREVIQLIQLSGIGPCGPL